MQLTTIAILLALAAAGLHAIWNVLLKTSTDPLRTSVRAVGSGLLIASPFAAVVWLASGRPGLTPDAWALVAASALAELAYFVLLSTAYSRGELSVVYPLARGTAPLLAVAAGFAILGERLGSVEIVGVVLLLAGILAVHRPAAGGKATIPALLTGVSIATYSAIDKQGTSLAAPWLYGWVLGALTAGLMLIWLWISNVLRRRTAHGEPRRPAQTESPSALRSALVGTLMVTSYLLVLFALRAAPLVVVAPARESAIVLVTLWGIWKLGEHRRVWLRVTGAIAIVAGLLLLVLH